MGSLELSWNTNLKEKLSAIANPDHFLEMMCLYDQVKGSSTMNYEVFNNGRDAREELWTSIENRHLYEADDYIKDRQDYGDDHPDDLRLK